MKTTKHLWRELFFIFLIFALCGGMALPIITLPVRAAPPAQMQAVTHVVISQVYGGGGNSNATYQNDYVELFNPTDAPVSINGWSIQYTSATGTGLFSSNVTTITNLSADLAPGQYILVKLGSAGTAGQPLPTPAVTGSIDLSAGNGKIALVNTTAGLSCNGGNTPCSEQDRAKIIDLIGYGNANFYEGAGAAPGPNNNTTSIIRKNNGCFDSDNNNADFVTGSPTPRTTASPTTICSQALTATASAVNLTSTALELTNTAGVSLTGTAADITSTASAVNATATSIAQTSTAAANSTGTSAAQTSTASSPTSTVATSTSAPAASVVISEFRTRGPRGANDEFIELYNPTASYIDISNWKINASNESGGTGTRATIPPSTILRPGQYYLVANTSVTDGYNNPTVPPNLAYGTGITDEGGIALLKADNTPVDQVGMSTGSAYKEGTVLAPFSLTLGESYERKPGGAGNNCQDTNNNANDFANVTPSRPQNYSSPLIRCGVPGPTLITTTTTITADTPDPSAVNGFVTVSVTVAGSPTPTGFVNITGANTNCTITLSASGTGSCSVQFTSSGAKTLLATYVGDNTHWGSLDTESHQVLTASQATAVRTPTRVPTLLPPPPLLVINEFVPRPGHDWNLDGVVNVDDEYIEILNHGVVDVNLSGYSLDDEVNIGSAPFRLPSVTLKPGERRVFFGKETGLLLSDGGDGVRLLKPNGQLMDAYNYFVVRFPDQSYCRLPDNGGADDWEQNCFPTPGLQNSLSGSHVNPPTAGDAGDLCPIADTLPPDFVFAECLPFGNNIWSPAYWDRLGWYDEKYLPESPGKWPVFVD